jgi:tetraacyldisaccharide 4'-kinase
MYAIISKFRGILFDSGIIKSSEFDIPIINVGNLAVGGSGKTPHIEYLIELLSKDYNIATLSRGYGRSTKGYREVFADSTSLQSGDEPLQIKLKYPKINVFVCEEIVEALTKLLFDNPNIDLILLDDAFQHRAIKAGFNILLTDYQKIFTRDKSMPVGRLREYPTAANRSSLVIVSKCPKSISAEEKAMLSTEISRFTNSSVLFSTVEYKPLISFNAGVVMPDNVSSILVISGLAKPQPMYEFISKQYPHAKVKHLEFRDHYNFTTKDISLFIENFNTFAGSNKLIIISEKDSA